MRGWWRDLLSSWHEACVNIDSTGGQPRRPSRPGYDRMWNDASCFPTGLKAKSRSGGLRFLAWSDGFRSHDRQTE